MLLKRAIKFAATGVLATGSSYVVMMLSLRVMNYLPAATLAWIVSVGVGFLINRRFTFGIAGPERRGRDFVRFLVGALLQLGLGLAGYSVTLGYLRLDPTLAFVLVSAVSAGFGFAYLNLVAFRRPAPGSSAKIATNV